MTSRNFVDHFFRLAEKDAIPCSLYHLKYFCKLNRCLLSSKNGFIVKKSLCWNTNFFRFDRKKIGKQKKRETPFSTLFDVLKPSVPEALG
ncbi:MAG: hypothetical protein CM15mP83_4950 [Flavobacteriaceae bacterium]|nr:MAG: hypothetical protein CM15mP83_4950 [Flavobacteriaceae bacterium]